MADSTTSASAAVTTPPAAQKPKPSQRRKLFIYLGIATVVAVALWGGYQVLVGSRYVSTDNAYVGAEVAEVTPLVSGPVAKILVSETQSVKAGDPLVVIDDSDARIMVAQAEAALGEATRRVNAYFANDTSLGGQVAARRADIARTDAELGSARSDLDRAQTELRRREALISAGAVSGDEITAARNRVDQAQAALAAAGAARTQALGNLSAAEGARQANTALIADADVESNPEVAAARARLDAAKLALERTTLRAPNDGVISRKNVQVGQQVQIGQPLMVVVPLHTAYVDANFKEVELARVAPGQPVELTADLYGDGVKFHGRVRGFAGGTGSAFSLIPAQNASGNWIKVVQRLPVRVKLDPKELEQHPLKVGLSMNAKIDTRSAD